MRKTTVAVGMGSFGVGTAVGVSLMAWAVQHHLTKAEPLLVNGIATVIHKACAENLSLEEIKPLLRDEITFVTQILGTANIAEEI